MDLYGHDESQRRIAAPHMYGSHLVKGISSRAHYATGGAAATAPTNTSQNTMPGASDPTYQAPGAGGTNVNVGGGDGGSGDDPGSTQNIINDVIGGVGDIAGLGMLFL